MKPNGKLSTLALLCVFFQMAVRSAASIVRVCAAKGASNTTHVPWLLATTEQGTVGCGNGAEIHFISIPRVLTTCENRITTTVLSLFPKEALVH